MNIKNNLLDSFINGCVFLLGVASICLSIFIILICLTTTILFAVKVSTLIAAGFF